MLKFLICVILAVCHNSAYSSFSKEAFNNNIYLRDVYVLVFIGDDKLYQKITKKFDNSLLNIGKNKFVSEIRDEQMIKDFSKQFGNEISNSSVIYFQKSATKPNFIKKLFKESYKLDINTFMHSVNELKYILPNSIKKLNEKFVSSLGSKLESKKYKALHKFKSMPEDYLKNIDISTLNEKEAKVLEKYRKKVKKIQDLARGQIDVFLRNNGENQENLEESGSEESDQVNSYSSDDQNNDKDIQDRLKMISKQYKIQKQMKNMPSFKSLPNSSAKTKKSKNKKNLDENSKKVDKMTENNSKRKKPKKTKKNSKSKPKSKKTEINPDRNSQNSEIESIQPGIQIKEKSYLIWILLSSVLICLLLIVLWLKIINPRRKYKRISKKTDNQVVEAVIKI